MRKQVCVQGNTIVRPRTLWAVIQEAELKLILERAFFLDDSHPDQLVWGHQWCPPFLERRVQVVLVLANCKAQVQKCVKGASSKVCERCQAWIRLQGGLVRCWRSERMASLTGTLTAPPPIDALHGGWRACMGVVGIRIGKLWRLENPTPRTCTTQTGYGNFREGKLVVQISHRKQQRYVPVAMPFHSVNSSASSSSLTVTNGIWWVGE